MCGRAPLVFDCARVWRRYFSSSLVSLVEGRGVSGRSACVRASGRASVDQEPAIAQPAGQQQQLVQSMAGDAGDDEDVQDADGAAFATSGGQRPLYSK